MKVLEPTYVYASVANIPIEKLGVVLPDLKGLSWDLDGTLAKHLGQELPEEHLEVIASAGRLGLRQAIISNAQSKKREARLRQITEHIHEQTGFELTTVSSREVNARKPRRLIFETAADRMGLEPSQIIHTGDQIVRDIIGPNRAGYMGSILVAPYGGIDDESWPVRAVQRPLERVVRVTMGIPLRDADFPQNVPLRRVD